MPAVTLHQVLADRALERSGLGAFLPAGPRECRRCRAAFHLGAVGPDLGYFPGGDRLLSDLSHAVRSTELTRVLLRGARSSVQRSFALGWLTHVLADERIHPLIGRAIGELQTGSREYFVSASVDAATHMRVEMGLDAHFARRSERARGRCLALVLGVDDARWIRDAYDAVHGLRLTVSHVSGALRGTSRMASGCSIASWGFSTYRSKPQAESTKRLQPSELVNPNMVLAFLKPVRPMAWLADAVGHVVDGFADTFERELEALDVRPDFNLDTGRLEAEERDHPAAIRARTGLRDRIDDAADIPSLPRAELPFEAAIDSARTA